MPSSRGFSQPGVQTQVSRTADRFFPIWATREAQEYWSGQPIPSPGDLPDSGIKLKSPALQMDSLPAELPGRPVHTCIHYSFQPELSWWCNLHGSMYLCISASPVPSTGSWTYLVFPKGKQSTSFQMKVIIIEIVILVMLMMVKMMPVRWDDICIWASVCCEPATLLRIFLSHLTECLMQKWRDSSGLNQKQ